MDILLDFVSFKKIEGFRGGIMKIYICIYSGLCSGAKLAVDTAYENLGENLYMYGEVLHNPVIISQLKKQGAKIINSINEVKFLENKNDIIVLIRAHGVTKSIIDELEENNIKYIDRTCKEVKKIHDIVYEMSQKKFQIIIIGNKTHPETIGTAGWVIGKPIILEDINEAKQIIPNLDNLNQYCVVVQTTYNLKRYKEIIDLCKRYLKKLQYFNTICMDTENRQKEIAELSKHADVVIVIGGKNSSNTNKLYKIALKNCKQVQFVEDYKELDFSNINSNDFVVVTGGASTPDSVIDNVVKCLHDFDLDMKSVLI